MQALGLDIARHEELTSFSGRQVDYFTTLEEAFHEVPETTGLDIEVKFPELQEAVAEGLTGLSRNLLVDRILGVVFRCAGERSIMFLSFDPDTVVLLVRKQNVFPVFMLTCGGEEVHVIVTSAVRNEDEKQPVGVDGLDNASGDNQG